MNKYKARKPWKIKTSQKNNYETNYKNSSPNLSPIKSGNVVTPINLKLLSR